MKMSDMRAKARAIFGPAIAEPMPKQPNGAKALQQRANARPIPTYKVGGPVKKMPTPAESAASGNRMARQEADEMRFMEMIEKLKRPMPTPAESVRSGNRIAREEAADMRRMRMAEGGKMPDLTGDGKVTRADVLKGRGVKGFAKGGVQTSSDTARKLATEMGGMKKGGKAKPKDGLAVIIAIGNPKKPTKKMAGGPMAYAEGGRPVKKMNGGAMAGGSRDMEASKVTRAMAMGGDPMDYMDGGTPMGYAAGGAGKTRKGQAPIKKAQGGAAKVRKGMMTPEGNIIDAMNKMRGK